MKKSRSSSSRVILGIDPGTTIAGYGVIVIEESEPSLISLGVIDMRKIKDHYLKIKHIFDRTLGLIDEYHPDELAIEAPFYGKNVQSMLKLGRAQGASIAAALHRSIPVYEYAPRKIKMSITGVGSASKEQVSSMLMILLKFKSDDILLDATDGLAAALCHYYQSNKPETGSKYNSWKDFMNKNPGRVK
ncbi:MAG: crossover junction endodeoxyribonuclease RuvC [Bacteroidales bacterium]|nr:crossover junction endodeoxyribonuclease RuvC [Bacteroidales bacterium]